MTITRGEKLCCLESWQSVRSEKSQITIRQRDKHSKKNYDGKVCLRS